MESCRRFGPLSIIARFWPLAAAVAMSLLAVPGRSMAQGWPGYSRDPQHSCLASAGSMVPQQIRWSTPVDLLPPSNGGDLLIHYGSPVITRSRRPRAGTIGSRPTRGRPARPSG